MGNVAVEILLFLLCKLVAFFDHSFNLGLVFSLLSLLYKYDVWRLEVLAAGLKGIFAVTDKLFN